MKHCIKKGEGGDPPENVEEAILTGLKKSRSANNLIIIADNRVQSMRPCPHQPYKNYGFCYSAWRS
jgi:hypothetical protein